MSTMSEENRRGRITAELEALEQGSEEVERIRIPWKSGYEVCPVIELSLESIVLNPRSHRIRAQLQSHPLRATVEEDPWGEDSQAILTGLLEADEGFEDLKANVGQEGQREPGVVTRSGLLVNANRRAVALRGLGEGYLRVAVLPPNADESQIAELELRLQMTKEFKQEYTFPNQLLFVEELRSVHGYAADKIALLLGYAQSSDDKHLREGVARVDAATRVLGMVREIQEISGGEIGLPHFDEQSVSLKELDEEYQKIRKKDPGRADRLRMNRYLGLITGSGYKVLRKIGPEFFEEYLAEALEEDTELQDSMPLAEVFAPSSEVDGEEDLGLGLMDVEKGDEATEPNLSEFVGWLASLPREIESPRSESGMRIKVSKNWVVGRVRNSLEGAVEQATLDEKKENTLEAPGNRLKEAREKVLRGERAFRKAFDDTTFDLNQFEYRLNKLEKAVKELRLVFDESRDAS
jgi:hypothetical protein